jgi:hypothetical protein
MRPSTTKPPAFASFSRLVVTMAIFAMAIFFGMATAQPTAAQGLTFMARQSSPHPARATTFTSLGNIVSVTSVAPTNLAANLADESAFRITKNLPSPNLSTLFSYQETKTSFVTEIRVPVAEFHLPVAQLRGSNLRFGFFMQTLHNSDVALGPLAATQALHSFSQPRSVSLYGVGVSIPLGRQSSAAISQSLPWAAIRNFIHDR